MSRANFSDKRVLVTGACGTVGSKLVEHLIEEYDVGSLVGLDNNESDLFFLDQRYADHGEVHFFLADVRDLAMLQSKFKEVDIVFHAAAFKHVVLCERSPFEAVQTNILGVQNVIEAANSCGVQTVIFTSSDKAVNPTNVMGTSKLMGERLITAANSTAHNGGPIFASTRFGNVLGSRGSVIPLFRDQIKRGGPITLTDPEMTRFIMSIDEATRLVIDSAILAQGGEVFVTKMPVIRIQDLAEVMIHNIATSIARDAKDIEIQVIGSKPGEKLYEELMSQEEMRRTVELPSYFSVLPAFKSLYQNIEYEYPNVVSRTVTNAYNSANESALDQTGLSRFLIENGLMFENGA